MTIADGFNIEVWAYPTASGNRLAIWLSTGINAIGVTETSATCILCGHRDKAARVGLRDCSVGSLKRLAGRLERHSRIAHDWG